MASTAENMRLWSGPALLSFGFRPFFLFGAFWAAAAMTLWVALLTGMVELPTRFDPVTWHAHELIFGYLCAIIAGFLLTAVPNWTGRLPVTGWPLLALFVAWAAGRIAVLISATLPPFVVALIDLSFLFVLLIVMAREIIAGKNWRNLMILGGVVLYLIGNALYHFEADATGTAASGMGLRMALSAAIMLISVIGGRIIPSFTRNWLVKNGSARLPTPFNAFDKIVLLASLLSFLIWIFAPDWQVFGWSGVGGAFLCAAVLHIIRITRWAGIYTLAEPLVLILHLGYCFVPLGFLAIAIAKLTPDLFALHIISDASAQHFWMAGAIGVMTLAVMTRATLGHTGRVLKADIPTSLIYALVIASVFLRVSTGFFDDHMHALNIAAALTWLGAFLGFVLWYGPMLINRKIDR